jgi:hypothetical protein
VNCVPMSDDELPAVMYALVERLPALIASLTEQYEEVAQYAPPRWAALDDFVTRAEELTSCARVAFRMAYRTERGHWPDDDEPPQRLHGLKDGDE